LRRALAAALALAALAGCADDPAPPLAPDPPPPLGTPPAGPRVFVVNTLSETISRLDPDTGTLDVQAAVTGAWANRISASANARFLLVADSGSNEVEVLDAADLSRLVAIDVGTGRNPWLAREIGSGSALATNWLASEVRVLDLRRGEAGAAIATTPGPEGFVVVDGVAFVACTNYQGAVGSFGEGRLDVVELEGGAATASVPVGRNPQDVVVGPDGRIHVLCTGDYATTGEARADIVDPATRTVAAGVPLEGFPTRVAAGPDGAMWVVGTGAGVTRYDALAAAVLPDPIDPALDGASLSAVAGDDAAGRVYVTSFDQDLLIAIDAATRQVLEAWLVGDGPVDVIVVRAGS